MVKPNKNEITEWFKFLQDSICQGLENLDGTGEFKEDVWKRPEGGGGRSRVIEGSVIEKGGVNFSAVQGALPAKICKALGLPETDFYATGVSIVLHPHHPMVPIIHMNVRYFETGIGTYWFGGGIDVTPHYINIEDARFFHQYLKGLGDKHNPDYYPKHKQWADDYFFIKHRKETRGIGGIFFDRMTAEDQEGKIGIWNYVQDVGNSFIPIYQHLVMSNLEKPYEQSHKEWQKIRRGRYVEFNLVWDKGTKFGLETNGRIESILMSMPPLAQWVYDHKPEAGSDEAKTLSMLKKEIDWINIL